MLIFPDGFELLKFAFLGLGGLKQLEHLSLLKPVHFNILSLVIFIHFGILNLSKLKRLVCLFQQETGTSHFDSVHSIIKPLSELPHPPT